jgi:hypothetical protein
MQNEKETLLISDIVKGKLKYSGHCVEGFDVFLA